jgi:hypothetical protein
MKSINFTKFSFITLAFFLTFGGTYAYAEAQPFDFVLSQEITTDLGPFGLLADDFNKDGNLDLVVGYDRSYAISILSGNNEGSFSLADQVSVGGFGFDFASGDFNGDGSLDLVATDRGVYLGTPGGALIPTGGISFPGREWSTVATGDFNNDGHLDVITAGLLDGNVAVFLGDGFGHFSYQFFLTASATNNSFIGLGVSEVGTGDFNEDGNLDIVAYNVGESRAFVFFGDGTGVFSTPINFGAAAGGRGLDVVDINKDGHMDILSEGSVDNLVYVFLGDGIGNFTRKTSFVGGFKAKNIAIADFDGNGNLDIIAPNQNNGNIDIAAGDGSGSFTFVKSITLGGHPRTAVSGDFNKDGFPDFAVNDPASGVDKTYIFLNNQNHAPVLDPIGNKTANEGETLTFTLSATDLDGNTLTYSASNLPAGATFDTVTGVFSWTPAYNQSGNYADVEFSVIDNGTPMQLDSELITITVGNTNRSPVFVPVGSQEVLEDQPLAFSVFATDPDGDAVVFSATNLPAGAVFDTGTAAFSWTPNNMQSGVYVVTFVALDDGSPVASSALEVPITVGDVPTPVEQADNLVTVVINGTFPDNVENSYLANLRKISIFIEDGKVGAAINQLNAFINKVETDMNSGVITQAEGEGLLALANALLADLQ